MLEWRNTLATGVEEIDAQHQEIFRRLNRLLEACKQGKGVAAVEEIIAFLEDYTANHFQTEEAYMQAYGYPEYEEHCQQHRQFLANFHALKERWQREGGGVHIVVLANKTVVNWLTSHIMRSDKAMGAWLKQRRGQ